MWAISSTISLAYSPKIVKLKVKQFTITFAVTDCISLTDIVLIRFTHLTYLQEFCCRLVSSFTDMSSRLMSIS